MAKPTTKTAVAAKSGKKVESTIVRAENGAVNIKASIAKGLAAAEPEFKAIEKAGIKKVKESLKKVEAAVKASTELKKAMTIPQGIKSGIKVVEEPVDDPADHIVVVQPNGTFSKPLPRAAGRAALDEAIDGPKVAEVKNHPCWCIASGCKSMVGNMISRCPAGCKGDGSIPCVHPKCKAECPPQNAAPEIIELPEPVKTLDDKLSKVKVGKTVVISAKPELVEAPKASKGPVCRRCKKLLKDYGQEFCGLCRNAIRMMSAENRAQWIPAPVVVKAKKAIATAVAPAAKATKPSKPVKKPAAPLKKPKKPLSKPKKTGVMCTGGFHLDENDDEQRNRDTAIPDYDDPIYMR